MREQVIVGVKEFFCTGIMPEGVNNTSIIIIPKVDNPGRLTDFRPISLCNVIYKVVAKCLVNRLHPILDDIISPEKSAFVPRRMITDNALLDFECTHYIQREKNPDKSFCAYKLDLSKAYDRVDRIFLERMMQKMGFARHWMNWIMTCVTSLRYTVKFNGTLLESFARSRGLQQGDPLSPFLFLFVADGLSALLKYGEQKGDYTPLKVCRRAPGISHLLFADDTMLFFKAEEEQARKVHEVVLTYERAIGQCINPQKCSVLFGKFCSNINHDRVCTVLNVALATFEEKYLGLPTPDGSMNKGKFQNLQSRLLKRIIAWGDTLSLAGKEIMIKAVAQVILTYIMGVFKLPMLVCDDLNMMI